MERIMQTLVFNSAKYALAIAPRSVLGGHRFGFCPRKLPHALAAGRRDSEEPPAPRGRRLHHRGCSNESDIKS